MSLYKLYMKYKQELFLDTNINETEEKKSENESDNNVKKVINFLVNNKASHKGKRIHNISELIKRIMKSVNYGKLSDICCLCFEEKQLILLDSACGLCKNLMCGE